ncbi:MAG: TetR/AcrR family transcriptional regulator [Steroidobacteraceae bacterium]
MPQQTRQKSPAEIRAAPGRPRKLTRERIIDGAVQLLDEQGFDALSMRSLALRLGINHATLYNYFDRIEDIEAQALESLMARVPIPNADSPTPMRRQLLEHLQSLRETHLQHPSVLHARIGSRPWQSLMRMQNRVLRVLEPHSRSLAEAAAGYGALVSLMASSAERARRIGGDYVEIQRRALLALPAGESELLRRALTDRSIPGPRIDSLPEILNYMIDRLLPNIDRRQPDVEDK